jgi:hypothetical protein
MASHELQSRVAPKSCDGGAMRSQKESKGFGGAAWKKNEEKRTTLTWSPVGTKMMTHRSRDFPKVVSQQHVTGRRLISLCVCWP